MEQLLDSVFFFFKVLLSIITKISSNNCLKSRRYKSSDKVYIVCYGYPLLCIALGAFKATIANIIGPFLFLGFPLLYLYGKEEVRNTKLRKLIKHPQRI